MYLGKNYNKIFSLKINAFERKIALPFKTKRKTQHFPLGIKLRLKIPGWFYRRVKRVWYVSKTPLVLSQKRFVKELRIKLE